MREFQTGQRIKSIHWGRGDTITNEHCEIRVIMENGQMAGVPWAIQTCEGGEVFKHNLALAESVELDMEEQK